MEYCLTQSDVLKAVTEALSDTNLRIDNLSDRLDSLEHKVDTFKEETEKRFDLLEQKVDSLDYLSKMSIAIGIINTIGIFIIVMKK